LVILITALSGCSAVISSTTGRLADNLAAAIVNHNDPETVRQGAPAYLLMIDSLIEGDPESPELLLTGARLYGSYASAFVDEKERSKVLSDTARQYGWRALCASEARTCSSWTLPYDEFESLIRSLDKDQVPALYGAAAAWATWIQANRGDMVAVADKARVQLMMQQVVSLDETYEHGSAYLYLGVLDTLLPAALGGKPEQGRTFFEKFLELSGGHDLMGKLLLAREYARLVYDRELHDLLCNEIVESNPVHPGLTLSNTLAIEEANRLLASADEFFGE
jgi:hypothetical protein